MRRILYFLIGLTVWAGGAAQQTTRSVVSVTMKDTTATGYLKETVERIVTPNYDNENYTGPWYTTLQFADGTQKAFRADEVNQLRFLQFSVPATTSVGFRIMQFNIREDKAAEPDYNTWAVCRAEAVVKMLNELAPDVVTLQECRKTQAAYLEKQVPQYTQIKFPKDGKEQNGGQRDVILYRADKFKLISWDKFWFSETPDVSSKSWDASTPKLTIFARFQCVDDETKEFFVYNTHFPPSAPEAQKHSVDMILSSIKEQTGGTVPVFFCGDLNLNFTSTLMDPLKAYLNHAGETALESDGVQAITYNGYRDTNLKTLDHIFYRNAIVDTYRVDNKQYKYADNCKWISDHYPIYSDVRF